MIFTRWKLAVVCVLVGLSTPLGVHAAEKRSLTVEDCICLHRIVDDGVKVSRSGGTVAYIITAPDTATNKNNYELWVRELKDQGVRENGRLLLRADEAAGLTWLDDDRNIGVLIREGGKSKIILVDAGSGTQQVIMESANEIRPWHFSISASGNAITYATPASESVPSVAEARTQHMDERGYSLPFGYPWTRAEREKGSGRYELNVLRRTSSGKWESEKVRPNGLDHSQPEKALTGFYELMYPALSPDGNYLAFMYFLDSPDVPSAWSKNRYVRYIRDTTGGTPIVLAVYDLSARRLRLAFDSPNVRQSPIRWSEDSHALAVRAVPPVDSPLERKFAAETVKLLERHVFTVDLSTSVISEILPPPGSANDALAYWNHEPVGGIVSWKQSDGELLIQRDSHTFARMEPNGSDWVETGRFAISGVESQGGSLSAVNREGFVGVRQGPSMPPDLFIYDFAAKQSRTLTDLNPEMREVALGDVSEVQWTNRYGSMADGYLIKPVGYESGKRYPLVILAYNWDKRFICAAQNDLRTAFPPQPLANAGFLVLEANSPRGGVPEGYSGGALLWEAENWVAMVEGAVEFLVGQGLADRNNVGLIGFSRSSWKTDFLLTHSELKLAAASSADSGFGNYGVYWLFQRIGEYESLYGGPPYGPSLQNWLKYAPAFNADKVRTPILMEYTGNGGLLPEPIHGYEFFTVLHRLGKAVELFFYPKGEHELDTPFERVASLRRNVDWFRFWLQGYEGNPPAYDAEQYIRWRKLRALQEEQERAIRSGGSPL